MANILPAYTTEVKIACARKYLRYYATGGGSTMTKLNFTDSLSGDAGVIRMLMDREAIIQDHFLLNGGECTPYYVAKELVLSEPKAALIIGEKMGRLILKSGIEPITIIGPQRYGVLLASQTALAISQMVGIKVRSVGVYRNSSGIMEITPDDARLLVPPFAVVDDVVSTHKTLNGVRDLVEAISPKKFILYFCLFDRTLHEDLKLRSLVQASFPRYKQLTCKQCTDGIPWNEVCGRGRKFNKN